MRIAREGWPFVLPILGVAVISWGAALVFDSGWLTGLAVVTTVLACFVLCFFRNPPARIPEDPQVVLSPGQGRVVEIGEVDEPTYMGGRATKISIFLSIFDVHMQRAPVSGSVGHRSYHPGGYAVAWKPKASEENEQASLGIETAAGPVLVRQIAGLVARRILTYPEEGDRVEIGDAIGLIRFGSRVDLFLPSGWQVTCVKGDRVRVGITPVARIP